MDYYIDITILPDPDFTAPFLMSTLFNKLHRALVELDSNRIGLSFPEIGKPVKKDEKKEPLGLIFRLHGEQQYLQGLMETAWLKGMSDHIKKTAITKIPVPNKLIAVRRVQCKSSANRMRRRWMKHTGKTLEQAIAQIPDSAAKKITNPYLEVKSNSTQQRFKLFIKQTKSDEAIATEFNTYGFAKNGALPSF